MSDERWARVKAAFAELADVEPAEREERLGRLRAEDPDLAADVEALLEADEASGDFLETPPPVPAELLARTVTGLAADEPVGPYRVLRELGRGGMGSVYLAERADGTFEQRVAIKVLRPGRDAADLTSRFLAERQILASLKHPGIARLLDGGTASDGRPYLVMEYVEGDPITAWCDGRRLSVEDRVALFVRVCRAVGHAHRHLLVHRDLKASNILVTGGGQPKLLDFGIAKLLEGSDLPRGAPPTRTGRHLMTPECASPEQVRGEAVTTASDVYQLGVLLYELLAGVRPYRLAGRSPAEVERIVCETRPAPPSERVEAMLEGDGQEGDGQEGRAELGEIARARSVRPARLGRRIAGDMDTIVATALRKDPERRYASADRLADDLERWLEGRPVSARADTLRYRASRFVRRHRGPVAAAAGLVLLLVALVVLSLRYAATTAEQAGVIAAERDRARVEAARAEQVTDFMVSLFESALPGAERRDTLSVRAVLDRASDRIDGALSDQPAVRAGLLDAVGRIQYGLGDVDEGMTRVAEGLTLRREIHDGAHPDVVESLYRLAELERRGYQFGDADTLYRQALALQGRLARPDSLRRAALLQGWAGTLRNLGQPDSAVSLMREAVTLRRTLQGEENRDYLYALGRLAYALRGAGEPAEAERLYREVLAGQRALGPSGRGALTGTLNDLAVLLSDDRGLHAAAVPLFREAIEIRGDLYGEAHPTTLRYMSNLTGTLLDAGELEEAAAVSREKLRRARRAYPDSSWQLGKEVTNLGFTLAGGGHFDDATGLFREARAIFAADLGPDHLWTAAAEHNLGSALFLSGRGDAGRRRLTRILPALEDRPRRASYLIDPDFLEALADRLRARGDTALAVRYEALRELRR